MALIQITADLSRVAKALEELVAIGKRAFPEPEQPAKEKLEITDMSMVVPIRPNMTMTEEELRWAYSPRNPYE